MPIPAIVNSTTLAALGWNYTQKKGSYRRFCQDMSNRFLQLSPEARLQDTTTGSVRLAISFLRPWFHRGVVEDFDRAVKALCALSLSIAQWPGQWWTQEHPEMWDLTRAIVLSLAEEVRAASRQDRKPVEATAQSDTAISEHENPPPSDREPGALKPTKKSLAPISIPAAPQQPIAHSPFALAPSSGPPSQLITTPITPPTSPIHATPTPIHEPSSPLIYQTTPVASSSSMDIDMNMNMEDSHSLPSPVIETGIDIIEPPSLNKESVSITPMSIILVNDPRSPRSSSSPSSPEPTSLLRIIPSHPQPPPPPRIAASTTEDPHSLPPFSPIEYPPSEPQHPYIIPTLSLPRREREKRLVPRRSPSMVETASCLVTGFLVGAFITLCILSPQRRTLLHLT